MPWTGMPLTFYKLPLFFKALWGTGRYQLITHPVYQGSHIWFLSLRIQRCPGIWSWGDRKQVCLDLVVLTGGKKPNLKLRRFWENTVNFPKMFPNFTYFITWAETMLVSDRLVETCYKFPSIFLPLFISHFLLNPWRLLPLIIWALNYGYILWKAIISCSEIRVHLYPLIWLWFIHLYECVIFSQLLSEECIVVVFLFV